MASPEHCDLVEIEPNNPLPIGNIWDPKLDASERFVGSRKLIPSRAVQ
jgi:hypothetical protein